MRVSILAIGSEILDGRVQDTNSNYLASELTELGCKVVSMFQCDDVESEIVDALKLLSQTSQVILVSGGLGPTSDDLTREAIGTFFGKSLIRDDEVLQALEARYRERKRPFDPSNANQAFFPAGAQILNNPFGTAAGFYITDGASSHVFSMPGVPSELKPMFKEQVVPRLKNLGLVGPKTTQRLGFKVFGLPEAVVGSSIKALSLGSDVTVSYRACFPEIHVLLKSEAANLPEIVRSAAEAVGRDHVFTKSMDKTLGGVVHELLLARKLSVSLAESCTGGLLGGALSSTPGSSAYFLGGVVTYSNWSKSTLINVPAETIEKYGAVSEQTAEAMALGARKLFSSDLALSITGIAGPDGGTAEKPVGTFFMGFADKHKVMALPYFFPSNRQAVRSYASHTALDNLRRYLLEIAFREELRA